MIWSAVSEPVLSASACCIWFKHISLLLTGEATFLNYQTLWCCSILWHLVWMSCMRTIQRDLYFGDKEANSRERPESTVVKRGPCRFFQGKMLDAVIYRFAHQHMDHRHLPSVPPPPHTRPPKHTPPHPPSAPVSHNTCFAPERICSCSQTSK